MNVTEISGDNANPTLWQFFVAVVVMNVVVMMCLSLDAWIHVKRKYGRKAGLKETIKSAF